MGLPMRETRIPWDEAPEGTVSTLRGIEVDNLLGFLTLLGLLRALAHVQPSWEPRASWIGPPWRARLHVANLVDEAEIADAASSGVLAIADKLDVDGRKNVDFADRDELRAYAIAQRMDSVGAALVASLSTEWPTKKDGKPYAGPLVMMFGQGHQNFLERLVAVPRGELPKRMSKLKNPPDLASAETIANALFKPWERRDNTDGFRWDPEDDQRYALRFGNPSKAGAAPTVHGANRLAAAGFLSYATSPTAHRVVARGTGRTRHAWYFVWPVWRPPMGLAAIEALLSHPGLVRGDLDLLRPFGVEEIYQARRIANGKFMNVTRAMPMRERGNNEGRPAME